MIVECERVVCACVSLPGEFCGCHCGTKQTSCWRALMASEDLIGEVGAGGFP
jgi:hypothetical protein